MARRRTLSVGSQAGWVYADLLLALCLVFLGAGAIMANDEDLATRVTDVNSRTADGTYGFGKQIDIIVTFSRPVAVDGAANLELDVGLDGSVAEFRKMISDNQLEFRYRIEAGAYSPDLNYLTPASLKVDGGGIIDVQSQRKVERLNLPVKDAAGSLSANRDLVIDARDTPVGTAPECVGEVERAPVEFVVKWTRRDGAEALESQIKENLGEDSGRTIGVMLLFGGARDVGQRKGRENADEAAQLLIASGWDQVKDMYYKPLFDQSKSSGELLLSVFLERDC